MRIASTVLLCAVLGGCSLSMPSISMPSLSGSHEPTSAARPAEQYVGKNLDTLVAQWGPPKRSQPLENDQTSYVWQFETTDEVLPPTGYGGILYDDGWSPGHVSKGYSPFCRVTVVTSADGVITQANTEESNGTGTPSGFLRTSNICEKQLRPRSRG